MTQDEARFLFADRAAEAVGAIGAVAVRPRGKLGRRRHATERNRATAHNESDHHFRQALGRHGEAPLL